MYNTFIRRNGANLMLQKFNLERNCFALMAGCTIITIGVDTPKSANQHWMSEFAVKGDTKQSSDGYKTILQKSNTVNVRKPNVR